MTSAAFVASPFRSIRFMGDSFANEFAGLFQQLDVVSLLVTGASIRKGPRPLSPEAGSICLSAHLLSEHRDASLG